MLDRSEPWGDHLITPVGKVGEDPKHFQMKCSHPSHNTERTCTKKRAVSFGGKEEVLLCLKYWASLGHDCDTADAHLKMFDEVVVPAWKSKTLPEEASLRRFV